MSLDNRLLEYDIDEVLFDEQSPFQRVQVVHSKSLGNMLVLDDLQSKSLAHLFSKALAWPTIEYNRLQSSEQFA